MTLPSPELVLSRTVVGRRQELTRLERALVSAAGGAGRCVLVSGEAGVGKSRILRELQERAAREGFFVLAGACFEPDSAFPYAALVDALRALFSRRSATEIEDLLGPFGPEIVKLVPELALALPEIRPAAPLDPEAEKRRSFETLTRFFERFAGRQPLVLVLEDLHWSDDLTLEYVHLLARRAGAHKLLVLTSYRPEEAPPALTQLLHHLRRDRLAEEMALAPLSRAESDELIRSILPPSGPGAADVLRSIWELTEGNPFAIEETLKTVVDAGGWAIAREGDPRVPRGVQDAVQRRIASLGALERDVLTIAAVAGRRFELGTLQEAAGIDGAELLRAIKAMIGAQLVGEEDVDRFAFRHALTREAIYAMLLRRERQALHRRVAEALERAHADEPDRYAADLGYHFHAAEAWEPALRYARRAGERAQAMHAPRAAIEHYNRALDAAERLGASPATDLLRARGRAYETIGYFEPARADYERATEADLAAGNVHGQWEGLIGLGRLWASRDYARTGQLFREALELARPLGDPATLATSLNRLGSWHANVAEIGEALRHHREALGLFEALDDRRGLVTTLDLIGMASQLDGDLAAAHAAYLRATEVWRGLGDRRGLAATLASMPLCSALYVHQLDVPAITLWEGVRAAEEGARLAREIGWRAGEAYGQLNLAMALGPLGAYRRAWAAASATVECAEEIEHRQWLTAGLAALGMVRLDTLPPDAAVGHLEKAYEMAGAIGSRIWIDTVGGILASAYVAAGRLDDAARLLDGLPPLDGPVRSQGGRLRWYARGELALARGDAEGALAVADELAAALRAQGRVVPKLWLLQGTALARAGDLAKAADVLAEASAAAREQQMRSLVWRIDAALARVLGAARRREEARACAAAARACLDELAAELDEPERRQLLEGATAFLPRPRAPTRARTDKERFGGLSARQREVAARIARGLSNKEIADELGVGLRTVEAHITQILMRLGFSSRTQVAAWAVGSGLVEAARTPSPTGRR